MDVCNNELTNQLKKLSFKINPFFRYFNFTQYDIITLGLFLNGVSLIYLLNNNFSLFILFLLLGHFCNILNILYVKQFNIPTKYGNNYDNLANWFKILMLLQVFYQVYKKRIDDSLYKKYNIIFCIAIVILILCNIHYSIKNCIRKKIGKKIDYYTALWVKPICNLNLKTLLKYCQFTKNFDENTTFIYLVLIMFYIHTWDK